MISPGKEKKVEVRNKEVVDDSGPFIFSPFTSIVTTKMAGVVDCEWVEGDVCEVKFGFFNPLPFQIKFTSMV